MPLKKSRVNTTLKRRSRKLPVIKKPIYFYEWRKKGKKSPVAFIGSPKTFPPLWKQRKSQFVIIDWKKRIVMDLSGEPIGKLPKRLKWDRYCPDTIEYEEGE